MSIFAPILCPINNNLILLLHHFVLAFSNECNIPYATLSLIFKKYLLQFRLSKTNPQFNSHLNLPSIDKRRRRRRKPVQR